MRSTRLTEIFELKFTQSEVDFVIPDLAADLPLSIDPFLLYKSRDESLCKVHERLVSIFNYGIMRFREGSRDEIDQLIDFPEVNEIGFGYSDRNQGSGMAWHLNRLLAETLIASPSLQERGLRHIEELQLVSIGVGPDRVSDIAANVLKMFLIRYTQEQAALWDIPVTLGVPVGHYFDFDDWGWSDGYFDLPLNPVKDQPVILVPRRIVRLLPWINYNDYVRSDFRMYLRPSKGPRMPSHPGRARQRQKYPPKKHVIEVTRAKLDLLDQYVSRKERESGGVEPTLGADYFSEMAEFELGEQFMSRLQSLPSGQAAASDYQRLVYEILNYLFEPELTNGQMEVTTHHRTERRDIIYTNESERSFLKYIRDSYHSMLVMFEIKNVKRLELDHINQTSAYLGTRLGMLGWIVTRNSPGENIILKTYAVYNDTPSEPRKTVLIITDDDLISMIRLKQEAKNPVSRIQNIYRSFIQSVQ